MKMKKRLLGILLALVMVLGLIPGMSSTAFAEFPITIDPAGGGTVSQESVGDGWYTCTATPAEGYVFQKWTYKSVADQIMGGVSESSSSIQSFRPDTANITAHFMQVVAVTGVSLNETTLSLTVGDDPVTLTANVQPDNATYKTVTWTTSDASVATVANGVVAPVGAGVATITATSNADDTKSASCVVLVNKADPSIETIPTASSITYGQKLSDSTLTGGIAKQGATSVEGTFAWKNTETKPAVSDSDTTEYDVVFTPTDADNYAAVECKVKLTVNKADPTVTAPTAKTLTYAGSAQELVNAGSTNDGTLYYAVTTDNTSPTDVNLYTTSIPTATDAGTYHVWYKVVGDANHNDTDPSCVTATIAESTPAATVAKVARPSTQASPSKGAIEVSWKAARGAKSYQVQWRKAGASRWTTKSVKGRAYTITGLKRGAAYQVRVRGVAGSAKGDWSKASNRWLKAASKVKATSGKKAGTVRVSWAKDAKATGGCRVYVYAKRGSKAVKAIEVAKGKASATVRGLKPGKTYYVRVRPYRKASGTTYAGAISGYRAVRAAK